MVDLAGKEREEGTHYQKNQGKPHHGPEPDGDEFWYIFVKNAIEIVNHVFSDLQKGPRHGLIFPGLLN